MAIISSNNSKLSSHSKIYLRSTDLNLLNSSSIGLYYGEYILAKKKNYIRLCSLSFFKNYYDIINFDKNNMSIILLLHNFLFKYYVTCNQIN